MSDLSKVIPIVQIAVAYHSGYGHTAKQAEAVARGAGTVPGTTVNVLDVTEISDDLGAAIDGCEGVTQQRM